MQSNHHKNRYENENIFFLENYNLKIVKKKLISFTDFGIVINVNVSQFQNA